MKSIPNIISLLRIPLALLFLPDNLLCRTVALVLAIITDILDGFLARRYRITSKLGTILDPLTDKFFVLFVLGVLLSEERIFLWQVLTMLSRDFAIFLFGGYLVCKGSFATYQCRAIWCGKIFTFLQVAVLLGTTWHVVIPTYIYGLFVALGICALGEFFITLQSQKHKGA